MTKQIIRFAGHRYGRTLEKPWILNPPKSALGGGVEPVSPLGRAGERWKAVSCSLHGEADRLGRNQHSERPVIGQYLESLAHLELPNDLESIEETQIGIIDVIITYGHGSKFGPASTYLARPTPLGLPGYGSYVDHDQAQLGASNGDEAVTGASERTSTAPSKTPREVESRRRPAIQKSQTFPDQYLKTSSRNETHSTQHLKEYIARADSSERGAALSVLEDSDYVSNRQTSRRSSSLHSDASIVAQAHLLTPHSKLRPRRSPNIHEDLGLNTVTENSPSLLEASNPSPLAGPSPAKSDISTQTTRAARSLLELSRSMCSPPPAPTFLNTAFPFPSQSSQTLLGPTNITPSIDHSSFEREDTNPFSTDMASSASSPLTPPPSSSPQASDHKISPARWVKLKYSSPLHQSSSTPEDTSPFHVHRRGGTSPTLAPEAPSIHPSKRKRSGTLQPLPASQTSQLRLPRASEASSKRATAVQFDKQPDVIPSSQATKRRRSKASEPPASGEYMAQQHATPFGAFPQPSTGNLRPSNTTKTPSSDHSFIPPHTDPSDAFLAPPLIERRPSKATGTSASINATAMQPAQLPNSITQPPNKKRKLSKPLKASTTDQPTTALPPTSKAKRSRKLSTEPLTTGIDNRSSTASTDVVGDRAVDRPSLASSSTVSRILDTGFEPGELSRECRVGYAEPGVMRNVSSVRGGWFRERGVVMGVRFIVG